MKYVYYQQIPCEAIARRGNIQLCNEEMISVIRKYYSFSVYCRILVSDKTFLELSVLDKIGLNL